MKTFLICTHCGRSALSDAITERATDDLCRASGSKLVCHCGRTDSWLWAHRHAEPTPDELPMLRHAHAQLQSQHNLRAAAIAAAVPANPTDIPAHPACGSNAGSFIGG